MHRLLLRALFAFALGLGLGLGGHDAAPRPAGAQAADPLGPGLWRAELGDFNRLVNAVAFAVDDVWAVGDGIVHFDGRGWKQVLSGRRPFFRAIDGLGPDQIWAAGAQDADYCDSYGLMYRYDGRSWQAEATGTHVPLYGLDMVSATEGWAVGGMQQAVVLRYDGSGWRTVAAPEVGGLRAVQALAPDDVWAVGDRGAIVHYDGQGWQALDGPGFAYLTDLHLLTPSFGWAVGIDRENTGAAVVLAFRNGRWSLDSFDEMPALYAVRSLGEDWTLAVGRNGVLMHHDGQTWREVGRTNPGGFNPWGFGPAPAGMPGGAAAEGGDPAAAPSGGGTDGDAPPRIQWDQQTLNSLILMPDHETLLAVGYAGQVVQVRDNLSWRELHTGHELTAIDMLSADYGWVVGRGGRPLLWDGRVWSSPPAPGSSRWVSDLDVVSRSDVWAVGRRGTVLHWDGQAWTQLPRFTWLDLVAVAFDGPADGWAVAIAQRDDGAPWDWTTESILFRWDGKAWTQVLRLCHSGLTDVAVQGRDDVWFAQPWPDARVLHWDGRGYSWHPILGYDTPAGDGARVAAFARGADGSLWAAGQGGEGIARLQAGRWQSQRLRQEAGSQAGLGPIAGGDRNGFWALTGGYPDQHLVHVGADGAMERILTLGPSFRNLAVVTGADGSPEVFLIGAGSTVLHYRAPSATRLSPLATATAALPAALLQPTPTPFSAFSRDEAEARSGALVDPEDSGEARLDRMRLMSLSTWWRTVDLDYLEVPEPEGDEDWPWFWREHGSLDPCDRGADLPVWVAEFSAGPRCPSHLLVVLDGSGVDAWQMVCFPRRVATVYLPLALRPRDPDDPALTPTPTPTQRSLTPEPVRDIQGACPTTTPWPDEPERR